MYKVIIADNFKAIVNTKINRVIAFEGDESMKSIIPMMVDAFEGKTCELLGDACNFFMSGKLGDAEFITEDFKNCITSDCTVEPEKKLKFYRNMDYIYAEDLVQKPTNWTNLKGKTPEVGDYWICVRGRGLRSAFILVLHKTETGVDTVRELTVVVKPELKKPDPEFTLEDAFRAYFADMHKAGK